MTAQQPANNPPAADEHTQLVAIQQRANALVDPVLIADSVNVQLDRLFDNGADGQVLDVINEATRDLLEQARTLHDTTRTTLEVARTLRDQREAARKALDDLKNALDRVDVDVPEVEALYETIEEMTMSYLWDSIYEQIYWEIDANTPLNYAEAARLLDILTGADTLPGDHPLWSEVRGWLEMANREIGHGN